MRMPYDCTLSRKDPAPVCVVSSRWMSPASVEVSVGEF